uniref:Ig-like domain-containing protein n=1 Tax=Amphiprion percula TaxID=161767 RepID=A0A3P8SZ28_AMPPE
LRTFTFTLLLVGKGKCSHVTHSIKYILTGSSGIRNLPEFVGVAMVNEVQVGYCDSNIKRAEFRPDWIKKMKVDDPQHHLSFRDLLENLKQRLNQTGGVHTFQKMYGCEWDDETEEVKSFDQFGYDGEDFVAFNWKAETWTNVNQWNLDNEKIHIKNFLTRVCFVWLKKYLDHGRSFLQRTDLPSVSLLQKTPSSQVTCHATGFYPDRADLFWRKDGEELHEDVDKGEILPNHDGTFQWSVVLKLSSIKPKDWRRYNCVFQMSGVKDDIIIKLDKTVIKTNRDHLKYSSAAALVVAFILVVLNGILVRKNSEGERPKSMDLLYFI